jgi:MurNAc alpha-1-phosphate uridylyltransferase
MIDTAMILAAGKGERMRPFTDAMPKPLIPVAGRSLIEHSMDRLAAHGVRSIVVNAHHLAQQIVERLRGRARIVREERLLDTGGSVRNALPHLGDGPFYVLNGDGLWRDGQRPLLQRLQEAWDPERMDALLLLYPIHKVIAREPGERGDYTFEQYGHIRHRGQAQLMPYLFAGISVCDGRLFRDTPDGAFSLLELWNRAEAADRLFGIVHDGDWFHIDTLRALTAAEHHHGHRHAMASAGLGAA